MTHSRSHFATIDKFEVVAHTIIGTCHIDVNLSISPRNFLLYHDHIEQTHQNDSSWHKSPSVLRHADDLRLVFSVITTRYMTHLLWLFCSRIKLNWGANQRDDKKLNTFRTGNTVLYFRTIYRGKTRLPIGWRTPSHINRAQPWTTSRFCSSRHQFIHADSVPP